jgi:hypothetical protein
MVLAMALLPDRAHYAPMDQAQLKRYRFFSKLGFFGVEPGSARGALSLLRVGRAILRRPDAALWITPQGRMVDPRERPVFLRKGIERLVGVAEGCLLVPLALEYPFGEERLPFAVARFGTATPSASVPAGDPGQFTGFLERQLEETQDALAADVCNGKLSRLKVLLPGRVGVGFAYDLWRRSRALISGKKIDLRHRQEPR